MKRLLLLSVLSGFFVLLLSGCGYMMAMHGMDHGYVLQKKQPVRTVVKEFAEKDVTLSFDVPPLSIGEEVTIVLRGTRTQSGAPISGAKVSFLIEQIEQAGGEHVEHHAKTTAEREADKITEKGIYLLKYRFEEHGMYRITARVWISEKEGAEMPLTIVFTQNVDRHEGHGTGKSVTPWVVIGGIGMAVMMLLIMVI